MGVMYPKSDAMLVRDEIERLRKEVEELKECLQVMSMIKCVDYYFQTSIDKDQLRELFDRFCGIDGEKEE